MNHIMPYFLPTREQEALSKVYGWGQRYGVQMGENEWGEIGSIRVGC